MNTIENEQLELFNENENSVSELNLPKETLNLKSKTDYSEEIVKLRQNIDFNSGNKKTMKEQLKEIDKLINEVITEIKLLELGAEAETIETLKKLYLASIR